jgi:hypothetical protein
MAYTPQGMKRLDLYRAPLQAANAASKHSYHIAAFASASA